MRVLITGASGFIGRALTHRLLDHAHEVIALTRDPGKAQKILGEGVLCVGWDGRSALNWQEHVNQSDAIINLAGENIGKGPWTTSYRKRILHSRVGAGHAVVEAIKNAEKKPRVLLQASGIGYYGDRGDEELDENSEMGGGFLADVIEQWEESTKEVETMGVRRVILRTGFVFGRGGGALAKMTLPYRLFVGGPVGSGKQWLSWIHVEDEIAVIQEFLERDEFSGVFNLTAPHPATLGEVSKHLGKAMRRPSWLPVPAFALKLMLGDMAKETALTSQKVLPGKLLQANYSFQYTSVSEALNSIFAD